MPDPRRTALGTGVAAAALIPGTAVLESLRDTVSLPSIVLLYLIPVLLAATAGGLLPAVTAALAAGIAVNWFFIPPYRTLAIGTGENLTTLFVYLLVAAAAGLAVDARAARALESRRLAVEARELAHIDQLRAALLGAVGHDLRTPLAGIKAAVSSLRTFDFSPADRADLLASVEESADRLTAVVDNLLAVSRLQAGVLSVDLQATALDAVAAQAAMTTDHTVEIAVPDDLPHARADPGLLERVLANLIANARTAAPGTTVTIRGSTDGDTVQLAVIDHGPGLDPHTIATAFAPFQRLNDHTGGGLGLGLAIARGFTEAQGGTLTPAPTPGGGLTMTITLPAATP